MEGAQNSASPATPSGYTLDTMFDPNDDPARQQPRRHVDWFVVVGMVLGLMVGGLIGAAMGGEVGLILGDIIGGAIGAIVGGLVERIASSDIRR